MSIRDIPDSRGQAGRGHTEGPAVSRPVLRQRRPQSGYGTINRATHNQKIAVMNAYTQHGFAVRPQKKVTVWLLTRCLYNGLAVHEIAGQRGKSRLPRRKEERNPAKNRSDTALPIRPKLVEEASFMRTEKKKVVKSAIRNHRTPPAMP